MRILLLVLIASFSGAIHAQQSFGCDHPGADKATLKKMEQLSPSKSTDIRIIPVVFHVVHQYGFENISDAQILNQMEILNKDFQRLNIDTVSIDPPFDTIIGNTGFEFRLAHLDPYGNPTTGIDRIASPLTNNAGLDSRINAWDPTRYVNIWVFRSLDISGVSATSSNPLVEPENSCNPGISILHSYVGNIGTGTSFTSRSLTHEMGHYFGLFHTFGGAITGTTCGESDGIYDTPYTWGNIACNVNANSCEDSDYSDSFNYWNFDPRDNVENFMDYSFCSRMFTNGQAAMMRAVQENPLYGRDQLSTEANLIATGTGPGTQTASTALPNADFNTPTNTICIGESLELINATGMQSGTTYSWSFPGGTPASSTDAQPEVTYANDGFYTISLTTTNANGSTTVEKTAIVYAAPDWADYTGPTVQNFNASPNYWLSWDSDSDDIFFSHAQQNGVGNSGCYVLNNHLVTDSSMLCTAVPYPNTMEGKVDELISPAFNLSNTTNIVVSFDYAYASAETNIPDMTEKLKIYSSENCGETWILRRTIADTALTCAFANIGTTYEPQASDWKNVSFVMNVTAVNQKTRFKIEFTARNHSNSLYIDNFNVDGVLGLDDATVADVQLFPNPITKGGTLHIASGGKPITVEIVDLFGRTILASNEVSDGEIVLPSNISNGAYIVRVNGSAYRLIID